MGGFPSGQRGQTVNLLQIASVVRIHLRPCRVDEVNGTVLSAYVHAFDYNTPRWCGGIGRRKGLKIPRGQPRAGSSPATSSKFDERNTAEMPYFSYFFVVGCACRNV